MEAMEASTTSTVFLPWRFTDSTVLKTFSRARGRGARPTMEAMERSRAKASTCRTPTCILSIASTTSTVFLPWRSTDPPSGARKARRTASRRREGGAAYEASSSQRPSFDMADRRFIGWRSASRGSSTSRGGSTTTLASRRARTAPMRSATSAAGCCFFASPIGLGRPTFRPNASPGRADDLPEPACSLRQPLVRRRKPHVGGGGAGENGLERGEVGGVATASPRHRRRPRSAGHDRRPARPRRA